MKTLTQTLALCLLTMGTAMHVMAQAEVNPDHFPDESASATSAQVELQSEIQQEEARIKAYESQLRAKYEMVEKVRNDAISAGLQGDGAECFSDEYRAQMTQLSDMWQSLRPQIMMAQNNIASLEARMVIVAGAGDKGAPVAHANRRAPGVILASSKNPRVVGAR
jgi:hypothetical protein